MVKATSIAPTVRQQAGGSNGDGGDGEGQPQALVPFVAASRRRIEPFHDNSLTLRSGSTQTVSSEDIPAIGFLAEIHLLVTASGGDGSTTAAVANEDAPFNVLDRVELADVNGNSIITPVNGYTAYLIQKYGANSGFITDPKQKPTFAGVDTAGNFTFHLTLPVVISPRDMLGALPNLNASQTYKLSYTIADAADVYDTQPNTLPDVRVQGWIQVRSQPAGQSVGGHPQATEPPSVGTTQYWSVSVFNVTSGQQTLEFPRVGNIIRTFALIAEDGNGARTTADLPSNVRIEYDGNLLEQIGLDVLRDRMAGQYGFVNAVDAAGGLDTGVLSWPWTDDMDGKPGYEHRNEWLHTTSATRLLFSGEFGANIDRVLLLTNDIAVPSGAAA